MTNGPKHIMSHAAVNATGPPRAPRIPVRRRSGSAARAGRRQRRSCRGARPHGHAAPHLCGSTGHRALGRARFQGVTATASRHDLTYSLPRGAPGTRSHAPRGSVAPTLRVTSQSPSPSPHTATGHQRQRYGLAGDLGNAADRRFDQALIASNLLTTAVAVIALIAFASIMDGRKTNPEAPS